MNVRNQICNRALVMINAPMMVAFDEETKEAQSCNLLYPIVKTEILSMYCWKGALKVVSLTSFLKMENKLALQYRYQYFLPLDLLTIVNVNGGNDYLRDSQYLYTNYSKVELKYITNVEDDFLEHSIINLITYKLAIELGYIYNIETSKIESLKKSFQELYLKITNLDSQRGSTLAVNEDAIEEASWIKSRY